MAKERQSWIDVCKGIAIVLVVVGHVATSYRNAGLLMDSMVLNFLCDVVYAFHMPLFFVISGLLAAKSSSMSSNEQIVKKLAAYGIPYVAFSVLTWALKAAASVVVNSKVELIDLLMIFVYPINAMWFLYALLFISIIKILLSRVQKNLYVTLLVALAVNCLAAWVAGTEWCKASGLSECFVFDVCKYYVWFELGAFLNEPVSRAEMGIRRIRLPGVVKFICCAALTVGYATGAYLLRDAHYAVRLVSAAVGALLTLGVSMTIGRMPSLEYLGKHTLPIYLLHGFVISATRVVITKLHLPALGGVVPLVACTVLGVAIPLCFYWICRRVKFLDFWFNPSPYLFPKKKTVCA